MIRKRFLAIVDPWKNPLASDVKDFPFLSDDFDAQCKLIHTQLARLKPLFDDIVIIDSSRESHPLFDELPKVNSVLGKYLSDKQDWDMWLCGFHYDRCIHTKIEEVIEQYKWNTNRFNIIQNISFMFPGASMCQIEIKRSRTKECYRADIKEYYWDYVDRFIEL